MGRPKQHDKAVRVALLTAAERLVETGGPAALSVRAVADEVNTTTRAVYSVFGSKQGLLEALAIRLFDLLSGAIDTVELSDDPRADVVDASVTGFRGVALAHSALYSLVFLRVVPDLVLGPAFDEIASATFGRLESLVARIEATAGLGTMSVREASQSIHALTEGLATMELRGSLGPPAQAEPHWRNAITALLAGITNQTARQRL
jgi:AcrR family transcriptional regulator